jgi:hypothetical protein
MMGSVFGGDDGGRSPASPSSCLTVRGGCYDTAVVILQFSVTVSPGIQPSCIVFENGETIIETRYH